MTDLPPICVRCGYDLRLLPADAVCPECGLAVHRSTGERIHPDDCSPQWVRRIAIGSLLVLISYLMGCGTGFFSYLPESVASTPRDTIIVLHIVLGWLGLTCLLHFVGNVMLSFEDRGRAETTFARLTRRGLWLSIVPVFWIATTTWIVFTSLNQWFNGTTAWFTVINYIPCTFLILPVLTFERLRRLALRLSLHTLANRIRVAALGLALSMACAALAMVMFYEGSRGWQMLFIAAALVAFGLFMILAIGLLFVITPRFFKSAAIAHQKWTAADASVA